jgi:HEAT repeat protein
METKQLLENLKSGDILEAFEAAKSLSKLPRLPAKRIVEVLERARNVHNREAAAYALSWLLRKDMNDSLQALLNIFNDVNENPSVRGQALEGLGIHGPTKRHRLWQDVEKAILDGLKDEAVEVRFWACYAAGTLEMKSALPQLGELSNNDSSVYPKWWRVSEEATDAIEWIHGRDTETRVPN